jgi:imidazolonepropionase-like amidohydrolase
MWASQFTADELGATVAACHAAGLPVAAHCHGIDGTHAAIDAGVDTIEHCSFFTDSGAVVDGALIDRIAQSGIPISATLGADPAHRPPPVVEASFATILEVLASLRRKGATIVVGTDAGIGPAKPHDALTLAVDHLRAIGLDELEMLTTLTSRAAHVIGLAHRKGRLRRGFDPDIVAVRGDATAEPEQLRDVRAVWRGGRRLVDALA